MRSKEEAFGALLEANAPAASSLEGMDVDAIIDAVRNIMQIPDVNDPWLGPFKSITEFHFCDITDESK